MPMIWAVSDATTSNINTAKRSNSGILLGFNEPDNKDQADDTVAVGLPSANGIHVLRWQGCHHVPGCSMRACAACA